MKWAQFHGSDKGSYLVLTDEAGPCKRRADYVEVSEGASVANPPTVSGDCPASSCTVRAAQWSLPGGRASATVQVDSVGRFVFIGVLTDQFQNWETSMRCDYAWCYSSSGNAYPGSPGLVSKPDTAFGPGSVVKVTLDAHRLTFNINGTNQPTIILPEDCGNISLGVTLSEDGKVTLLSDDDDKRRRLAGVNPVMERLHDAEDCQ